MRWAYLLSMIITFTSLARAQFMPPADGKLTEKQVVAFIQISNQQIQIIRGANPATAGPGMDQAVANNGMSLGEYNWIDEQLGRLLPLAVDQKNWETQGKPDLEKLLAARQEQSVAAKAILGIYEQASQAGKSVQTKEQRETTVAKADSDRDSLMAEIKTDQEAIKPISDEIAQHDKDATDAETQAKSPPTQMSADDKSAFIDQKKNDAQGARDAAKDARDRLSEAQKSLEDAKARLAIADGKMSHPDMPITDHDKTLASQTNEQVIAQIKIVIAHDDSAIAALKDAIAAGPNRSMANGRDKPDPDNVALVQKHLKEYLDAIGTQGATQAK